jgi:UDP-N-acetylmuramyl tripeptide synthase
LVVVDYAHSPDALENALLALREVAQARGGRLVCVFGCGGDRDHGKRPMMGEVATQGADHVVLTSDNPRNEAPLTIIEDIRVGARSVQLMPDRQQAIAATIAAAAAADVILVAGKGHEAYQEVAGAFHPFSDLREVENALVAWKEAACA